MTELYHQEGVIGKLFQFFSGIFGKVSAPTLRHLFDLCLSILGLDRFRSVKFNFEHFIQEVADYKLKSLYYALNESNIDLDGWMERLLRTALYTLPVVKGQAVILSIDDTMVAKAGEHFELRSTLYDHAEHGGSSYLDGHCFVCLMVSVPVWNDRKIRYIHIPVGYRVWTKEMTKLKLAASMVRKAMNIISPHQTVCLCCDSWYAKDAVADLVKDYGNLSMICAVRNDTVLYDLPPERTGKRGRPRVHGDRLSLDSFTLFDVKNTEYQAGYRPVLTNLFGKKEVLAIMTQPQGGGSKRLFLCTMPPKNIPFDPSCLAYTSRKALAYFQSDTTLLALSIYTFRWHIEVSFYEQKTFWSLGSYMLRSKNGLERLVNLITIVYSAMSVLPYGEPVFSDLKDDSPQQTRFVLGNAVLYQLFLATFGQTPETLKKYPLISQCLYGLRFEDLLIA